MRRPLPLSGRLTMPLRFFIVPAVSSQAAEDELNGFLARHRVIGVDRRWVDLGTSSFWAICVDYLAAGSVDARRGPSLGRNRVDYKQVLDPDEFTVFSRLRELRKEIAQADAVPVYAVLTNEQLALMVQQRCRTAADLGRIEGVGEARVEKYGDRILQILTTLAERSNAADGQPLRADS
jgi:superfamily II DNA helicase RecQ